MEKVPQVIQRVGEEFEELSGRTYSLIEEYKTEDADLIVVAAGSTAGTVKTAIEELREEGVKAGLLKIRVFRPFPVAKICQVLKKAKAVAVLDRSASFGAQGGPIFLEVRSALFGEERRLPVVDYIYGLGGRDISIQQIKGVYRNLQKIADTGKVEKLVDCVGLRE